MVKIVTDSTADMPPELVEELGVTMVPLTVLFGQEAYRDGVDLGPGEFFVKLAASPVLPTTAQPPAGAFLEVYRRLAEETNEIVSIHISSKISGTINSALLAKNEMPASCRIEVVDSLWTSMSLGLVVTAAAREAQEGASIDEVLQTAQNAIGRVHLLLFVDTLEYLQRGGRIGRAAAFLGSILNVKPLITMKDGEVHPVERIRTRSKAMERIYDWARGFSNPEEMAVMHSASPDDAVSLLRRLSETFPGVKIHLGQIGAVIGTHVGPGAVGVMLREGRNL